jgi:HSP20 family molecular chaperone IbpA
MDKYKLNRQSPQLPQNALLIEMDRLFSEFNRVPVFHNLEQIYKTGDQVRFSSNEDGLTVQIDLPGVPKDEMELKSNSVSREVYISGKRQIVSKDGKKEYTYNRSFSVGQDYDIDNISFKYTDGVLEVLVPRSKRERENIKTYKLS